LWNEKEVGKAAVDRNHAVVESMVSCVTYLRRERHFGLEKKLLKFFEPPHTNVLIFGRSHNCCAA